MADTAATRAADTASILDLRTGREIADSAVARPGPFKRSSVYDHGADAAAMVVREMNGIDGEGHFLQWIDEHKEDYDMLILVLRRYAADELLRVSARA